MKRLFAGLLIAAAVLCARPARAYECTQLAGSPSGLGLCIPLFGSDGDAWGQSIIDAMTMVNSSAPIASSTSTAYRFGTLYVGTIGGNPLSDGVTFSSRVVIQSGSSITLSGVTGWIVAGSSISTTGGVFANDFRVTSTGVDLDAAVTEVGVSTAQIRTELTAVGVSTAQFRTEFTAVGVSTAQLRTEFTAVGVSTSGLRTDVTTLVTGKVGKTTLLANGVAYGVDGSSVASVPAMAAGGLIIGAGTGVAPSTGTLTAGTGISIDSTVPGKITVTATGAAAAQVVFSSGVINDFSFTQTGPGPCATGSTITWTSSGVLAQISYSGNIINDTNGTSQNLYVLLDGDYPAGSSGTDGGQMRLDEKSVSFREGASFIFYVRPSAGLHRACLTAVTSSGTSILGSSMRAFSQVIEW